MALGGVVITCNSPDRLARKYTSQSSGDRIFSSWGEVIFSNHPSTFLLKTIYSTVRKGMVAGYERAKELIAGTGRRERHAALSSMLFPEPLWVLDFIENIYWVVRNAWTESFTQTRHVRQMFCLVWYEHLSISEDLSTSRSNGYSYQSGQIKWTDATVSKECCCPHFQRGCASLNKWHVVKVPLERFITLLNSPERHSVLSNPSQLDCYPRSPQVSMRDLFDWLKVRTKSELRFRLDENKVWSCWG